MRHVLWYLLAGTRGGPMRARLLLAIHKRPMNANRLAKLLSCDYKTVQHHLDVLRDHDAIEMKGGYGAVYFCSAQLEAHWSDFGEIWEQIGKESGEDS